MISNKIAQKMKKIHVELLFFFGWKKRGGFYSGEYGTHAERSNWFVVKL